MAREDLGPIGELFEDAFGDIIQQRSEALRILPCVANASGEAVSDYTGNMGNNQHGRAQVGLYARISEDASGDAVGVQRQLEDARAMASASGWDIAGEWMDNDVSALNGAPRPGYRALMAAAELGKIQKIVVFHTSRLWRNRLERAEGIKVLAEARVSIAAVKGPELDLGSAYGRGLAGLIGEFDTLESEVKGERVRAAAEKRARAGRASGPVAYGWVREPVSGPENFRDVIDPHAADVVRHIVKQLLSGVPLHALARELNAAGEPTPSAYVEARRVKNGRDPARSRARIEEAWGPGTVKKLALRPSNVALRIHHRGRATETYFDAAWDPLITREQYEAVRAMFKPGAVIGRRGDRQYLLTGGVGYCEVCGGILRTAMKGKPGHKTRLYVCESGCVGRKITNVDELVRAVVSARLASDDLADLLSTKQPDDAPRRERMAEIRVRLDEAAESFGSGNITLQQLETISARLRPELEALEAAAPEARGVPIGLGADIAAAGTPERIAELWGGWTVPQRRALIEALGLRVIIKPAKGGPGFKPEGVGIEWKGSAV